MINLKSLKALVKKKKSEKKVSAICKYCLYFFNGKIEDRGTNTRKCSLTKQVVTPDNKSCELFTLYSIFFCVKSGQRIYIKVCLNRRGKKVEGCTRCKVGTLISNIVKEVDNE